MQKRDIFLEDFYFWKPLLQIPFPWKHFLSSSAFHLNIKLSQFNKRVGDMSKKKPWIEMKKIHSSFTYFSVDESTLLFSTKIWDILDLKMIFGVFLYILLRKSNYHNFITYDSYEMRKLLGRQFNAYTQSRIFTSENKPRKN